MTPSTYIYAQKCRFFHGFCTFFVIFFTKSCKISVFKLPCGHEINFASKFFCLFSFKFKIYSYLCSGYQKLSL